MVFLALVLLYVLFNLNVFNLLFHVADSTDYLRLKSSNPNHSDFLRRASFAFHIFYTYNHYRTFYIIFVVVYSSCLFLPLVGELVEVGLHAQCEGSLWRITDVP